MGRPKLLLPFHGDTVVGSLVRALRAGGIPQVVLVTAPDDDALRAWAELAGVRTAINPDPERGMLSSILAGIAALGGAAELARRGEPLVVCPADLPALQASTVATVLAGRFPLAVPIYRGRRGHPLVVSPGLIPEIETLDLDVGLRELLERHPDRLCTIEVDDPGAVRDIDTPDEYRALAGSDTPP
jgi:molybdenum cofactor cytidylyltransferase